VIDLFHGSLLDGRIADTEDANPSIVRAIYMPQARSAEIIEPKRLAVDGGRSRRIANVRWRDGGVALPDTLGGTWNFVEREKTGHESVTAEGRITNRHLRGAMAKKPTIDDARLILELYDLRREAEMRKARHWWVATFWPKSAEDFIKVALAMGTEENNWLRQVGGYWGIAVSFLLNGVVSEKLFFQVSFCGEMYFIFAKVRPFLKEIREKMSNPELFLNIEKAIMGSKIAREQFAKVEARVAGMRQQK
jgi:hypothetical protein